MYIINMEDNISKLFSWILGVEKFRYEALIKNEKWSFVHFVNLLKINGTTATKNYILKQKGHIIFLTNEHVRESM